MSQVTAPIITSTITLSDPFAANSTWSLWDHSSEEKKWTPSTYKQIHTILCWCDFWELFDTIGDDTLLGGFFFLMRDPIPPLWENKGNIRGGSYTIRVPRRDSADVFLRYSIASILGETMKNISNNVVGISIAPKRAYNVISIWNDDFAKFNSADDMNILARSVRYDEIRYTKHIDKKF
jgi:translation initiation factor 4E